MSARHLSEMNCKPEIFARILLGFLAVPSPSRSTFLCTACSLLRKCFGYPAQGPNKLRQHPNSSDLSLVFPSAARGDPKCNCREALSGPPMTGRPVISRAQHNGP